MALELATQLRTSQAQPEDPPGVPIDSIQPGGGLFFRIELGWGRLRRGWLRLARPGYVRRMAERRRGECPGCSHDILDPRDLKLWRNVCGHSFAVEDDTFAWRDRVRFARAGLCEVVVVSLVTWAVLAPSLAAWLGSGNRWFLGPAALAAVHWAFVLWFFRDPERTIAAAADALLSPADGLITHLEEVDAADFPHGRAFRISMWLSPLDVHLNRAPRDGRVVRTRYFPGRFVNARRADSARINEQLWLDMVDSKDRQIRVIQISGSLARRLVCWVRAGEELRSGARYGMIKYGSRCDVMLPAGDAIKLEVKVGDKVHAGTSVLLRYVEADGHPSARA